MVNSYNSTVLLGHSNPHGAVSSFVNNLPLPLTSNVNVQGKDSALVNIGTVMLSDSICEKSYQNSGSFGRWMNDTQTDSHVSFDAQPVEQPAMVDPKGVSDMMTDKMLMCEQIFTITDMSPSWALSTEETKVRFDADIIFCSVYILWLKCTHRFIDMAAAAWDAFPIWLCLFDEFG